MPTALFNPNKGKFYCNNRYLPTCFNRSIINKNMFSNPIKLQYTFSQAAVAQLVEQLIRNQKVCGSIPRSGIELSVN
ncbi:protein of unknown function [Legionella fallonii LLAP-10]|uniref:Uncharacterized protein n=1 Tax=Legionella fallonii LLAP-10 TaxID=1212491 RepID=A0A098G5P7_9GAMM|nr:protein of unknown function [Legionella fallonii LLAP-10]